jgi:cyclopropane-fatty-acyl-phospholipid synthase
MWEYYLAGFEASFRYYGLAVFQIQLVKSIQAAPLTRDYMYRKKLEVDSSADFQAAAE